MEKQNFIDDLENEIRILKINEEKLSPEMKQGKYKKAMMKQRQKVIDSALNIVNDVLPGGCILKTSEDAERFQKGYNEFIEKNAEKIKSICIKILNHYSIEKLIEELTPICSEIFSGVYTPIFKSHNTDVNGKVYNDIIEMFWDDNIKIWRNGQSFRFYPEP